jgi:hypothetical protein
MVLEGARQAKDLASTLFLRSEFQSSYTCLLDTYNTLQPALTLPRCKENATVELARQIACNLSAVVLALNRPLQAVQWADKAIALDPASARAHFRKVRSHNLRSFPTSPLYAFDTEYKAFLLPLLCQEQGI